VIGVIPRAMIAEERAHRGLTRLIAVDTMHERKSQMAQLADAFVALPGGIGTLEEIIEVFTWLQLGLLLKPVGLLNAAGFYDALLQFLGHMRAERFLTSEHYSLLTVGSEVEPLLDELLTARPVHFAKPIERVSSELLNPEAK
ncbi:MAG TPA: TIGR00730 family Rossman fold protein, partial [Candidatus Binatia bacterium]|nr:TIGR00730 family Rossman fold protein [Candidatus Binatia bacterium]